MTPRKPKIKTISNEEEEIVYLYHISDVHIRNDNERVREYQEVFERLYEKLRELKVNHKKHEDGLIVITGDIFHINSTHTNSCLDLINDFLKKLVEIMDIIMIAGNHDMNQSNTKSEDSLSAVTKLIENKKIHYLAKSGIYQYNNIFFGVSSLRDNKFVPRTAFTKKILNKSCHDNKFLVALYHGTLKGSEYENGTYAKATVTKKSFDGYDYVLLGDIHKHQYLNKEKTIAYAGSLIQQRHGESLNDHGFILWDLKRNKSELIEIPNDYGFCDITIEDGEIVGEVVLPPKPTIKFKLINTTGETCDKIILELRRAHKIDIQEINKFNAPAKIINIQPNEIFDAYKPENEKDIISHYLGEKGYEEDAIKYVIALHEKIKTMPNETVKNFKKHEKIIERRACYWKLLEVKFSNMLVYGEDNVINLQQYDANNIIGLFAKNQYGKSSLIDIIIYCLYGTPLRGCSDGHKKIENIINNGADNFKCCLTFSIESRVYQIFREGTRGNQRTQNSLKFRSYEINDNEEITNQQNETCGSITETEAKIISIIGDMNNYFKTCIHLQEYNKNNDFISMTKQKKREFIHSFLGLNVFEKYYARISKNISDLDTKLQLKKKLLSNHNGTIKDIKGVDINELKVTTTQNIKALESELEQLGLTRDRYVYILKWCEFEINKRNNAPEIRYENLEKYKFGNQRTVEEKRALINEVRNRLTNAVPKNIEDIIKEKARLEKIRANLRSAATINAEINTNSANISTEKAKLINIDENIPDLKTLTNKINNISEDMANKIDPYINLGNDQITTRIGKLNESIENINPNIADEIKKKTNDLDTIKSTRENIATGKYIGRTQYIIANTELKSLESFREHLDEIIVISCNCPNQPDRPDIKQKNQNYLSKVIEQIEKLHVQLKLPVSEIADDNMSEKYISDLDNEIANLNTDSDKYKDIKNQIEILQTKIHINNRRHNMDIAGNIEQLNKDKCKLDKEINNNNTRRNKLDIEINKCDTIIKDHRNSESDLQTLEFYELNLSSYENNLAINRAANARKTCLDECIAKKIKTIAEKERVLEIEKTNLSTINEIIKLERIIGWRNIYKDTVDPRGLPFKMLENALPNITKEINNILMKMTNFTIKFHLYSEEDTKKCKQDCIDVYINNPNQGGNTKRPLYVDSGCGSEKFIIGIAFRIAIYKISKISKSNFFIVDEGWTSIDKTRLADIKIVLDYIKNEFDHVIIISHLSELTDAVKYIIKIYRDINAGVSHINNTSKN